MKGQLGKIVSERFRGGKDSKLKKTGGETFKKGRKGLRTECEEECEVKPWSNTKKILTLPSSFRGNSNFNFWVD